MTKDRDMEIQTTAKDVGRLPDRIRKLRIPPDTFIRVILDVPDETAKGGEGKELRLPFLDTDIWDDAGAPKDLSKNHDHYLYGLA